MPEKKRQLSITAAFDLMREREKEKENRSRLLSENEVSNGVPQEHEDLVLDAMLREARGQTFNLDDITIHE